MTRDVITAEPRTPIAEALETLSSNNIRHLPILKSGRLVGLVSDRDLRLAVGPDASADGQATVEDVMTTDLVTSRPGSPVEEAARLLTRHRIGCLPVLEDGELVGIVTRTDLLEALAELLGGREVHSRIEMLMPDRPGELARVVKVVGIDHGINITGVVVPPPKEARALVVLHLETRESDDLVEHLRKLGYDAASPALDTRPD